MIQVKAMLIAPNASGDAHVVSVNPPTRENPYGFHRLIGGSVEHGEANHDAIIREVREELVANVLNLEFIAVVENIFELEGEPGHEIVFLYSGMLDPQPPAVGGVLTESDGTVLPLAWRSFDPSAELLPLFPVEATKWLATLSGSEPLSVSPGAEAQSQQLFNASWDGVPTRRVTRHEGRPGFAKRFSAAAFRAAWIRLGRFPDS